MLLHLFSTPGEPFLADIIAAARQILAGLHKPLVAYLPAAAEERHFVRETKAAFRGIAEVRAIKPEIHSAAQMRLSVGPRSLAVHPRREHLPGCQTPARRWIDG